MQVIQAIVLGLTQGLTEFIPVSSSGHLILVGHLIGFKDSGLAFDTALNLGTLAALLAFFWKDFIELAVALVKKNHKTKLAYLLILATIPAVILGVLLQKQAETIFRSNSLVAVNLMVVAIVMLIADRVAGSKTIGDMDAPKALGVGLAQSLALVPGVSRSGITISAGLFEGFDRVAATRFSFLLSAPIIAGATAKVVLSSGNTHALVSQPGLVIPAIIASFVSGYWAIGFLLKYLSRHGLRIFAYYRLAVGLLVLLFAR